MGEGPTPHESTYDERPMPMWDVAPFDLRASCSFRTAVYYETSSAPSIALA